MSVLSLQLLLLVNPVILKSSGREIDTRIISRPEPASADLIGEIQRVAARLPAGRDRCACSPAEMKLFLFRNNRAPSDQNRPLKIEGYVIERSTNELHE